MTKQQRIEALVVYSQYLTDVISRILSAQVTAEILGYHSDIVKMDHFLEGLYESRKYARDARLELEGTMVV